MKIIYFLNQFKFFFFFWMLVVSINFFNYKFTKFFKTLGYTLVLFFFILNLNPSNIFNYEINNLLILNNFNVLCFQPFYDQNHLWSVAWVLTEVMVDNAYLSDDPIWIKKLEISLIIDVLKTNFLTYSDCLLLINELTTLNSIPGSKYFINEKLIKYLEPENNLSYYEGLKILNRSMELYPVLNVKEPVKPELFVNLFEENNPDFTLKKVVNDLISNENYLQEYWKFEIDLITSVCNSFLHNELYYENIKKFYLIFLYNQLTFLNLVILFFRKKIFMFIFINLSLFSLMLWNLYRLATASNLIYSLIHFLFFAILSGLITLFWGSTYIGFCILLIYGAAIPVLALYIIMLVNVDLIQRLFFVEHNESKSFFSLIFRSLLLILIFILFLTSLLDNLILTQTSPNFNIYFILFYFLLAKRYIKFLEISYTNESIYDLANNFYYSDIDKVASAAFNFSSNELIALVLLLLIAIIVVIGISWGSKKIDENFYEESFLDLQNFSYSWVEQILENLYLIKKEKNLIKFLQKKSEGSRVLFYQNSSDLLIYYQIKETNTKNMLANTTQKQRKTKYFFSSPYDYWYTLYDSKWLTKFLIKNDEFANLPYYKNTDKHFDDYYFCITQHDSANYTKQ